MPSDYEQHRTATEKPEPISMIILLQKAIRAKIKVREIRPTRGVVLSVLSYHDSFATLQ